MNFSFICSNIPATPAYGVYISQLIRYSRACGSYHDFLDGVLLLTRKPLNQRFLVEIVTVATMLGLTVAECVTNGHECIPFVVITIRSFPHPWHICGFVTRLTLRVPHMEQDLLKLRSTWVHPRFFSRVRIARSSVFCVMLSLFVLGPFLLTIVLCVLLRVADSDYSFGIL